MIGAFFGRHLKFKLLRSEKLREQQKQRSKRWAKYILVEGPPLCEGTPGPYYVKLRDNPPSNRTYTHRYEGTHGETPFAHLLLRELARQFNESNGREHIA